MSDKRTLIEDGTELKGTLTSNCPIVVMGRVEGELTGPSVEVTETGVLADCQIAGAGSVTVHGHFFERESPGIVGPREVIVSSKGALVASVEQIAEQTRFAFERGSRLRLKIIRK